MVRRECIVASIIEIEDKLKPKELNWCNRLMCRLNYREQVFDFDLHVQFILNLRLANVKSELNFWCKILELAGKPVDYFTRRSWLESAEDPKYRSIRSFKKGIPTDQQIIDTLRKVEPLEKCALWLMILSGRRAADISRIRSADLSFKDSHVYLSLSRDKVNSSPVVFSFEWRSSLDADLEASEAFFREIAQREERPFETVNWQLLRRKADFRIHGLQGFQTSLR